MAESICSKFLATTARDPDRTAILYCKKGQWLELSWGHYRSLVIKYAAGLKNLGIQPGDKVAILANTRVEWALLDMAILCLGAATVPIYQNSTLEDVDFILRDSEAKIFFCETPAQIQKLSDTLTQLPHLAHTVSIEPGLRHSDTLMDLADLGKRGEEQLKATPDFFAAGAHAVSMQDLATLIYTSGTTGRPKGVVLTHAQIMSEVTDTFPLLGVTPRDRSLTFLPFAHILGRIEIWGHILTGYTMAFAENIERLKYNLIDIKPTLFIGVPRIFEKIHAGIMAQAEISPVKKKAFELALKVGHEVSRFKVVKQPIPLDLALKYKMAKYLVFDAINQRLGGQLRFAVCGGAPLSREIAEFFHAADVLILEGYGMTETTAAITVNTPFDYKFGTVGKPIGDVRLQIAEDGEILIQSKKVMKEYHNDAQSTAAVLKDGWLHSGDIGEITPEGFLRITDRKKDLIKTAGGKYVAPQRLEGLMKMYPMIANVHIHGDQKKYIVALVTLNFDYCEKYAKEHNISFKDHETLSQNPKIRELIRKAVANTNSQLASYESIKNFAILKNDFTIENGEMTPSLKVRRKVVDAKYEAVIDKLYGVDS